MTQQLSNDFDFGQIMENVNNKIDLDLANISQSLFTQTTTGGVLVLPFKNEQGHKLCIQWGHEIGVNTATGKEIIFYKSFADNNYCIFAQANFTANSANDASIWAKCINKRPAGVNIVTGWTSSQNQGFSAYDFNWLAIGFIE